MLERFHQIQCMKKRKLYKSIESIFLLLIYSYYIFHLIAAGKSLFDDDIEEEELSSESENEVRFCLFKFINKL